VDRLLLGPAADDPQVRQLVRPAVEEVALAPARLEQRHVAVRQRVRKRDARRAAARAHVDDRALESPNELDHAQGILEQHPPSFVAGERGQAGCSGDGLEPALDHTGSITTKRLGSVPSLRVTTPVMSFNWTWTTFRSTAVIGSSSTERPDETARSALRFASAERVA